VNIVYFSNVSNNTHRLVRKVGLGGVRIPYRRTEEMPVIDGEYVLITPTYELKDGVPHQVRAFLSINHAPVGVIATGNRNFAGNFGIAGRVLSNDLQVPELVPPVEISGTSEDIQNIQWKVSEISVSVLS
jgi:protein involved in ribonucleotide reduction